VEPRQTSKRCKPTANFRLQVPSSKFNRDFAASDSDSEQTVLVVNLLQPEATFKSEVLLVVNPLKIVANLPGPGA